MPAVVFVTAYEQHALRAFEVHPFDYLLKPVNPDRVLAAVERAAEFGRSTTLASRLAQLVAGMQQDRRYLTRVPLRHDGIVRFAATKDIERIDAADKQLRICLGDGTVHTIRSSISALEQRLDPRLFARVHRSTIVNVERITEIQRWFNDEFVLLLRSGSTVSSGGAYRNTVRALMEGRSPGVFDSF